MTIFACTVTYSAYPPPILKKRKENVKRNCRKRVIKIVRISKERMKVARVDITEGEEKGEIPGRSRRGGVELKREDRVRERRGVKRGEKRGEERKEEKKEEREPEAEMVIEGSDRRSYLREAHILSAQQE